MEVLQAETEKEPRLVNSIIREAVSHGVIQAVPVLQMARI